MTDKEAIEIIKVARAEVEWEYPMEYAAAFDRAIEALEREPCNEILSKIREEVYRLHREGFLLGLEYKMIDLIIERFEE